MQTVLEETSSTESSRQFEFGGDSTYDVYNPASRARHVSASTLEAEIMGEGATTAGKPMSSEPEFGPEPLDDVLLPAPEALRRSFGSFSAVTSRESETVSPTER